jgi:diaminohydroxyphosphoribosylaminopyrimidine deaminase/5-amino-6-(5-phosphoribosylamino)uracil reductase
MEKYAEFYIKRCFDLARLGAGFVSPNPMVGAVLVHAGRIIGEGYHQRYGGPHAEVNTVAAVATQDRSLIASATLYVSLEPCCIYGKTPPCTNLILQEKIPRVVISCLDLSPEVKGRGVEILRQHGVEVITGVLEAEGKALAATRNVAVSEQRPYVILKMAITPHGYFAPADRSQFWITQGLSKRLVHRWRMEADAILVGTTTALQDNPQLDNRHYYGKSPLRIVLDRHLSLPADLQILTDGKKSLVVTALSSVPADTETLQYLTIAFDHQFWPVLLHKLWQDYKIGVLLVEGGAQTLKTLIESNLWDEARVFRGVHELQVGVPAPLLPLVPQAVYQVGLDRLSIYQNEPRS